MEMEKVTKLFRKAGWKVVTVQDSLLTIAIVPLDISRMPARINRLLQPYGVSLVSSWDNKKRLPCAWVEFDVASLTAFVHVRINDSFLGK